MWDSGDRLGNFPAQLSGGEQQRVAIARALAKNPKLLLCDEPTGALDYVTGKAILGLLQNTCRQQGMTVVVITHNSAIAPMADQVIHIKNGRVDHIEENPVPVRWKRSNGNFRSVRKGGASMKLFSRFTHNRLITDALREIRATRSPVPLSILVLSALAVCFLAGLRATEPDMKNSADRYLDSLRLMDLRVAATLGLTDEDIALLSEQPGVRLCQGGLYH